MARALWALGALVAGLLGWYLLLEASEGPLAWLGWISVGVASASAPPCSAAWPMTRWPAPENASETPRKPCLSLIFSIRGGIKL